MFRDLGVQGYILASAHFFPAAASPVFDTGLFSFREMDKAIHHASPASFRTKMRQELQGREQILNA